MKLKGLKSFRIITNGKEFQVEEREPGFFSTWEQTWVAAGPAGGLRSWPTFQTFEEAELFMKERKREDYRAKLPWSVVIK